MSGETQSCARCGRVMTRMEGFINGAWFCHPDDPNLPDCYTITSHEASDLMYGLDAVLRDSEADGRDDKVLADLLRRMIHGEYDVSIDDDDGGWVLDTYVQLTDEERAVVLRTRNSPLPQ